MRAGTRENRWHHPLQTGRLVFTFLFIWTPGLRSIMVHCLTRNSVTVPWESREFSLNEEAQMLTTSCCPFTRHCSTAFWFLGIRVHGDGLLRTQGTLGGWVPIEKQACYFHPDWVFWGRHFLTWQRRTVWSWICLSSLKAVHTTLSFGLSPQPLVAGNLSDLQNPWAKSSKQWGSYSSFVNLKQNQK